MVIYEVNLKVNSSIASSFLDWLKSHVAEMLEIEGFESAEILEERERDNDHLYLTTNYRLSSFDALQSYFDVHAERMRNDGKSKFGDQFSATRRVLNQVDSLSCNQS